MQLGADGSQHPDPAFSQKAVIGGREILLEFTHHAQGRMKTRGVLVDEVIECIRLPDERGLDVDGGDNRCGVARLIDGRRLKVVYDRPTPTRWVVVSAMWDRR